MTDTWPACATYPNLGCVCRGALGQNKSTCTRKRTGDLEPIRTAGGPPMAERTCRECALVGYHCGSCGCCVPERADAHLLASQCDADDLQSRLYLATARAESAEAENARLRAERAAVEAVTERLAVVLAAHPFIDPVAIRLLREVRDDFRAALDSPTSHTQQEAEVGARVLREAADASREYLTTPNLSLSDWLRARADALAADTTNPAPNDQETP